MRTATSFKPGNPGRRPGSRNKVRREVRALVQRLERDGALDCAAIFTRLNVIALNGEPKDAIPAALAVLNYRFGKPVSSVDLDVEHSGEVSIVAMLEEIARRPEHRARLEESERLSLAPVIEVVEKEAR